RAAALARRDRRVRPQDLRAVARAPARVHPGPRQPAVRHPIVEEDLDEVAAAPLPWDALAGARVLVTGASGFLASFFVDALLRANERHRLGLTVLALARSPEKARARFGPSRDDLAFV